MTNKQIKSKNIIRLWFQVLFYSLLISALFFIFLPETKLIKNLIAAFFPIVSKQWWYISSYFALFFCIPFLNKGIEQISRKTFQKFLLVVLIFACGLDLWTVADPFALKNGYSPAWLIIMYLFGSYIKKYDLAHKFSTAKSITGYFGMITLTFASKFVFHCLSARVPALQEYCDTLISYTSITILFSSVFLFMFCLRVKINAAMAKIICFFSPATLGVYLIHVHPLVFKHIVNNAFVSFAPKPLPLMLAYVLSATLLIFLCCSLIDLLRIQIFQWCNINRLGEILARKIDDLYSKLFKN